MAQIDVSGYLARIGARRDDSLADLQCAHLRTVPFENLSVHLGEKSHSIRRTSTPRS